MKSPAKKFILGPFFKALPTSTASVEGLQWSGCTMEFATDEGHFVVPIFRNVKTTRKEPTIHDYLYNEELCLPVTVRFPAFLAVQTSVGLFVPIDRLIAGIFDDYTPAMGLLDFLEETSSHLPHVSFSHDLPSFDYLVPSLSKLGFAVPHVASYGDSVRVELCWVPKLSQIKGIYAQYFYSGSFRFRPKPDGTLGKGSWGECWECSLPHHLFEALKALGLRSPIACLSEEGIQRCLSVFEWQPKHRISKAALAKKRLTLVGKNRPLWGNPKALSRLLKEAGLYSAATSESQIRKTVTAMIARLSASEHSQA